jgi:hypothetical protein
MNYSLHNIYNYFFKRNEFELESIILENYTLMELKKKLNPVFKLSCQTKSDNIIATFNSYQTIIKIKYNLNGKFICKLSESWK